MAKNLTGHVITSLATLAIMLAFVGVRPGPSREAPVAQIPGVRRLPAPAPGTVPPPAPEFRLPAVAPPAIPPEVLKAVAADEQNNIHVYSTVNRSVVNITTASDTGGLF